jgi:egghead protein (zeste-white 4 protein)
MVLQSRRKANVCDLGYHFLTVALLGVVVFIFTEEAGAFRGNCSFFQDPFQKYGIWITVALYFTRYLTFITFPLSFFNFLGIVLYNTWPKTPTLKGSVLHDHFICFRVVTKGIYPNLVKKNVERNINICSSIGLFNFIFEIVTEKAIDIPKSMFIKEIVVPFNYRTSRKTLYKARALQYCLEDNVNTLNDDDWIVHLDEETVLTKASVIGILNFIAEGTASFGQGIISYANEEIFSWVTTIFDFTRVGADYGILRFCLKYFKKPVFSWKGSYVVSNAGAERSVSYDFGIEGSIAEDCFFGLTAWKLGYSFGFIEGEMWEKSPFSLIDYIRQRKRWIQGITMTFLSRSIPWRQKCGILFVILGWVTMPLTASNTVLVPLYPLPMPRFLCFLCGFMGGVMMFLFILGALKSFNYQRTGLLKFLVICCSPVFLLPFFVLTETCAVVCAFLTFRTIEFHTVKKEKDRILHVKCSSVKDNDLFDV